MGDSYKKAMVQEFGATGFAVTMYKACMCFSSALGKRYFE